MLDEKELYILSYYRASELAGALLFGKLAFHTTIDKYRIPMTEHCQEEAMHAWLWTKTIKDLGGVPLKVTDTYQTEYGKLFGLPKNTLEVFCLTQILERRVLEHFTKHMQMPGVNPLIKKTLKKMIDDEEGHIGWIYQELEQHAEKHGRGTLDATMDKLKKIDEKAYDSMSKKSPFSQYFKELM